jgi:hypothetical protein
MSVLTHDISGLKHNISGLTHDISVLKQRQQEDDSEKAARGMMRGLQAINSNLRLAKNSKIHYQENLKIYARRSQ